MIMRLVFMGKQGQAASITQNSLESTSLGKQYKARKQGDYNRSFDSFRRSLFNLHVCVLICCQPSRLLLVPQVLLQLHAPCSIVLNFLNFNHQRGGLPSALAAVLLSQLPDCVIDASIFFDDFLMMGVALYGIAGPNIVAHHLIDANATFLLGGQIEQPAHRRQEFHVALVFRLFPVIFLGVLANRLSTLHLLDYADACIQLQELLEEWEGRVAGSSWAERHSLLISNFGRLILLSLYYYKRGPEVFRF